MPKIVSDLVDTFPFRKLNARPQFLVLRRRRGGTAGTAWQAIHTRIAPGESTVEAARRDVKLCTGLVPIRLYNADYVSQFYDHGSDAIILAPTLAAQIDPNAPVSVIHDYSDYAWCDLEETTARLAYTAQRWAVRHIYDVIAMGGEEAEIYAI